MMTNRVTELRTAGSILSWLCAGVLALGTAWGQERSLRFEAETVAEPASAWIPDRDTKDHWNLWSTDRDAEKKWSGGVVLRSPSVMEDRKSPEDGAPPLHIVLRDVPPGVYNVEMRVGRVVGVSRDGKNWVRFRGGVLYSAQRFEAGKSFDFWVDDMFAITEPKHRGPAYVDYIVLTPLRPLEAGIPNAGFEEAAEDGTPRDWTWWSRDGEGRAVVTQVSAHGGRSSVRITYPGKRDWACTSGVRLAVRAGQSVGLHVWARAADAQKARAGRPFHLAAVGYSAGKRVSWNTGIALVVPGAKWTEGKGWFEVPEDVDEIQVRLVGSGPVDVLVDDVAVREERPSFASKPKVNGWAKERVQERFDRGLVALPRPDGTVYLSWRLLKEDPPGIGFDVFRIEGGRRIKLNRDPGVQTTDFVDVNPPARREGVTYLVRPASGFSGASGETTVAEPGDGMPYVRIPLRDKDEKFQKVAVADLNGDGRLDFVIKQPDGNVDPWSKVWYASPETFKIEAYLADGTFLWRRDLGWAIERGVWYSPYVVYDLNGDGRAEVAVKVGEGDPRDEDGRVTSGPEYLAVWNGMTGEEIARAPWPPREAFSSYNHASRNQIAVAYLDGRTPCILALRGTYGRMLVHAWMLDGRRLVKVWEYDNVYYGGRWWGQGAHFTIVADVDRDGRDEILLGCAVLDDNGAPLWSTGRGHNDWHYLTDILPDNPGLEVAYGLETAQRRGGGINVVDAATGRLFWKLDSPTRHIHAKGMCADIDPTIPGPEIYGADADGHKLTDRRWLFSADGTLLRSGLDCPWGFSVTTLYWDADLQKEILRGRVSDYEGGPLSAPVQGSVRLVADILGDWREEIVTSVPGELRIYSTTIPAMDRRVFLQQDPVYRMTTVMNSMGYTQPPTLSYDPVLRSVNLNVTIQSRPDGPACRVVVSAPRDRGVKGRLRLEAAPGIMCRPDGFEVDVAPGAWIVRVAALHGKNLRRSDGWVRARLEVEGARPLVVVAPVRMPAGLLTTGLVMEAEKFAHEAGGKVRIRDDKSNVHGKAISHWDDRGHVLAWRTRVPEPGEYRLLVRYCCPWPARRRVQIGETDLGTIVFPSTGGFGTDPADWNILAVAKDGREVVVRLPAGECEVRMENVDGKGCNLDALALQPVAGSVGKPGGRNGAGQ